MPPSLQAVQRVGRPEPVRPASPSVGPSPRRFSVAEYHRMVEVGIIDPDERVELLDGVVIAMPSMGGRHAWSLGRLNHRLVQGVGEEATVNVQIPVTLSDDSEPEPDVALIRPLQEPRLPRPTDVLLLVEIGLSSARNDREVKAPRYAQAGIPELWLVDLEQDLVRVLRQPGPHGWGETRLHQRGEVIAPLAFPELRLEVSVLLGPSPEPSPAPPGGPSL